MRGGRVLIPALGLGFAMSVLVPAPARAGTVITVTSQGDDATNNGNCTLREAVIAANLNSDRDQCPAGVDGTQGDLATYDTIVLPETFYARNPAGTQENDALDGDLDIRDSVVIDGAPSTIDASGGERIFHVVFEELRTIDVSIQDANMGASFEGGGIFVGSGASLWFTNGTMSNFQASSGGVSVSTNGTAVLDRVTIWQADAVGLGGTGGGIDNAGTLTVTNSTISGNTADRDGGGINSSAGTVTLNNVTITANTAADDPGAMADVGGGGISVGGGTATIRNSIVAGNTDGTPANEARDCEGLLTSAGHNLVGQDDQGCTFGASTGDQVGTPGSPLDPGLGPLSLNGGSSETHALLIGSPARDAGDPTVPGSGGTACEAIDQRGEPRPEDGNADGNATCDVGAYEAPTVPTKEVGLKASRRKVLKRRRVRLTATVTPCPGHEGDVIQFFRGSTMLAEKPSDAACVAIHRIRMRRTSRFHAVSPKQDADHGEAVSAQVKIRVKRPG